MRMETSHSRGSQAEVRGPSRHQRQIIRFNPTSRDGSNLGGNPAGETSNFFTGTVITPTTNPLENAEFFASQHYRDFLDREADPAGLSYWSGQISSCGNDAACVRNRRIGVSAAFFVELEFQQTGSFVYRLYKGGLARRPTYQEFITDRAQVREGSNSGGRQASPGAQFCAEARVSSKVRRSDDSEWVCGRPD